MYFSVENRKKSHQKDENHQEDDERQEDEKGQKDKNKKRQEGKKVDDEIDTTDSESAKSEESSVSDIDDDIEVTENAENKLPEDCYLPPPEEDKVLGGQNTPLKDSTNEKATSRENSLPEGCYLPPPDEEEVTRNSSLIENETPQGGDKENVKNRCEVLICSSKRSLKYSSKDKMASKNRRIEKKIKTTPNKLEQTVTKNVAKQVTFKNSFALKKFASNRKATTAAKQNEKPRKKIANIKTTSGRVCRAPQRFDDSDYD